MGDIIIGVEANNRNVYIFIGFVVEITDKLFVFIGVQISGDAGERAIFIGFGFPIDMEYSDSTSDPIPTKLSAFVKLKFSNIDTNVLLAVEQRVDDNSCYAGLYTHNELSCFFGLLRIISINI